MARRVRATAPRTVTKKRNGPVQVRHVFDDLAPALRQEALRHADGDVSRVVVLSPSRFEVLPR